MSQTLMINEIFYSIQGESTWAGLPCAFVRLMGCHLRCHYCDTEYAFHEGRRWSLDDILAEVERLGGVQDQDSGEPSARGYGSCDSTHRESTARDRGSSSLVEITGGEPLLQPNVHALITRLCDADHTVLIETSGACDISRCDPRAIRIMDLKTPGSGQSDRNLWANLDHLTSRDEVKFVLCSREDYEWARALIEEHRLDQRVHAVLMSAVAPMSPGLEIAGVSGLSLRDLADWILEDHLPVRLQTQLHKLIWDPLARGV